VELYGQKLGPDHVVGTMALLLIAGIDTTWSAIGSALWHLAKTPADRERLAAEPALLPTAMEEFLRAYAPVTMARLVKEDMQWHGVDMKADDWVLLSFPAANRDPAQFDRAGEVVIDRAVNRHAAFGLGIHRCVVGGPDPGAALAPAPHPLTRDHRAVGQTVRTGTRPTGRRRRLRWGP
jgi:hypothetical protein